MNDTFIESTANKITRLGLAVPAVLLLEAHKPLAFLGSQLLLVAQPTLEFFLPRPVISQTVALLEDPAQLESLITRLETNNLSSSSAQERLQ